ncbi:MAG: immunoglobulin domain-containing protein [Verrucomicrobiota bacterium]
MKTKSPKLISCFATVLFLICAGQHAYGLNSTTTSLVSSANPSCAGGSVTFTATVTPYLPVGGNATMQFESNGVEVASVAMGNSSTATTTVSLNNAGTYTINAVFSGNNIFASSTSTNYIQTVNGSTIVSQPASVAVYLGSVASFSVTATGDGLTYQWQVSTNGGTTFNNVTTGTGGTTANYTTDYVSSTDNGNQYHCVVSSSCGSTTSSTATLTVLATFPTITTQPQSQTAGEGTIATFSVAASGAAPLSYQWQFNNVNIPGATNVTYTVASVIAANAGNYTVVASNSYGSATSSTAVLTVNMVTKNSTGLDFWVSFFNTLGSATATETLLISAASATTGTVSIPGYGNQVFSVVPGEVTTVDIPNDVIITDYDIVQNKGIHVTANQPVSVYLMNYDYETSEGTLCYPTPMLGTNYCVMSRASTVFSDSYYVFLPSQFAIVATEDHTTITITPSATANLTNHLGTNIITKTLQQGQTYQICSIDDSGDVTGTFIASDKRIGVFGGAEQADVPDRTYAGNQLDEEQLPVSSWGTQALGFPLATRLHGDTYRVLAANDGTDIYVNGTKVATEDKGEFYDTTNDGPVVFQGSKPIQVAQFSNGTFFDRDSHADPFEILLPPTGHYMTDYTIPVQPEFDLGYVNLIVEQSAIATTLTDGVPVSASSFMPIGGSGYYGVQIPLAAGTHTISSPKPVGVQVYGYGPLADGYGYNGGIANGAPSLSSGQISGNTFSFSISNGIPDSTWEVYSSIDLTNWTPVVGVAGGGGDVEWQWERSV